MSHIHLLPLVVDWVWPMPASWMGHPPRQVESDAICSWNKHINLEEQWSPMHGSTTKKRWLSTQNVITKTAFRFQSPQQKSVSFQSFPQFCKKKQRSTPNNWIFSKLRDLSTKIYPSSKKPKKPRLVFQHRQPRGGLEITPHPGRSSETCWNCTKIDGFSVDFGSFSISKIVPIWGFSKLAPFWSCFNLSQFLEIQLEIHSISKPQFPILVNVFRFF